MKKLRKQTAVLLTVALLLAETGPAAALRVGSPRETKTAGGLEEKIAPAGLEETPEWVSKLEKLQPVVAEMARQVFVEEQPVEQVVSRHEKSVEELGLTQKGFHDVLWLPSERLEEEQRFRASDVVRIRLWVMAEAVPLLLEIHRTTRRPAIDFLSVYEALRPRWFKSKLARLFSEDPDDSSPPPSQDEILETLPRLADWLEIPQAGTRRDWPGRISRDTLELGLLAISRVLAGKGSFIQSKSLNKLEKKGLTRESLVYWISGQRIAATQEAWDAFAGKFAKEDLDESTTEVLGWLLGAIHNVWGSQRDLAPSAIAVEYHLSLGKTSPWYQGLPGYENLAGISEKKLRSLIERTLGVMRVPPPPAGLEEADWAKQIRRLLAVYRLEVDHLYQMEFDEPIQLDDAFFKTLEEAKKLIQPVEEALQAGDLAQVDAALTESERKFSELGLPAGPVEVLNSYFRMAQHVARDAAGSEKFLDLRATAEAVERAVEQARSDGQVKLRVDFSKELLGFDTGSMQKTYKLNDPRQIQALFKRDIPRWVRLAISASDDDDTKHTLQVFRELPPQISMRVRVNVAYAEGVLSLTFIDFKQYVPLEEITSESLVDNHARIHRTLHPLDPERRPDESRRKLLEQILDNSRQVILRFAKAKPGSGNQEVKRVLEDFERALDDQVALPGNEEREEVVGRKRLELIQLLEIAAGLEETSSVEPQLMKLVDQLQTASRAGDGPHVAELLKGVPQVKDQEKNPRVQELLLAIQGYRVGSLLYPYYAGTKVTEEVLRNFKEALPLIPPLLEPDAPFEPETQAHFQLNLMEAIRVLTAVDHLTESEADAYLLNPRLHLSPGSVWLRRGDFALKELLRVGQLAPKLGAQANLISAQEDLAVRRAITKAWAIFSLAAAEDPQRWIDWNSERGSLLRFARALIGSAAEGAGERSRVPSAERLGPALVIAQQAGRPIPTEFQEIASFENPAIQLALSAWGVRKLEVMADLSALPQTSRAFHESGDAIAVDLQREHPEFWKIWRRRLFPNVSAGLEEVTLEKARKALARAVSIDLTKGPNKANEFLRDAKKAVALLLTAIPQQHLLRQRVQILNDQGEDIKASKGSARGVGRGSVRDGRVTSQGGFLKILEIRNAGKYIRTATAEFKGELVKFQQEFSRAFPAGSPPAAGLEEEWKPVSGEGAEVQPRGWLRSPQGQDYFVKAVANGWAHVFVVDQGVVTVVTVQEDYVDLQQLHREGWKYRAPVQGMSVDEAMDQIREGVENGEIAGVSIGARFIERLFEKDRPRVGLFDVYKWKKNFENVEPEIRKAVEWVARSSGDGLVYFRRTVRLVTVDTREAVLEDEVPFDAQAFEARKTLSEERTGVPNGRVVRELGPYPSEAFTSAMDREIDGIPIRERIEAVGTYASLLDSIVPDASSDLGKVLWSLVADFEGGLDHAIRIHMGVFIFEQFLATMATRSKIHPHIEAELVEYQDEDDPLPELMLVFRLTFSDPAAGPSTELRTGLEEEVSFDQAVLRALGIFALDDPTLVGMELYLSPLQGTSINLESASSAAAIKKQAIEMAGESEGLAKLLNEGKFVVETGFPMNPGSVPMEPGSRRWEAVRVVVIKPAGMVEMERAIKNALQYFLLFQADYRNLKKMCEAMLRGDSRGRIKKHTKASFEMLELKNYFLLDYRRSADEVLAEHRPALYQELMQLQLSVENVLKQHTSPRLSRSFQKGLEGAQQILSLVDQIVKTIQLQLPAAGLEEADWVHRVVEMGKIVGVMLQELKKSGGTVETLIGTHEWEITPLGVDVERLRQLLYGRWGQEPFKRPDPEILAQLRLTAMRLTLEEMRFQAQLHKRKTVSLKAAQAGIIRGALKQNFPDGKLPKELPRATFAVWVQPVIDQTGLLLQVPVFVPNEEVPGRYDNFLRFKQFFGTVVVNFSMLRSLSKVFSDVENFLEFEPEAIQIWFQILYILTGKKEVDEKEVGQLSEKLVQQGQMSSDLERVDQMLNVMEGLLDNQLPISVDAVSVAFQMQWGSKSTNPARDQELKGMISRTLEVTGYSTAGPSTEPRTGLEEVQVMPMATLKEQAVGDLELRAVVDDLEAKGSAGLLLIKEGAVLTETPLDSIGEVHLFAHPTVMDQTASFLRSLGIPGLAIRRHSLPSDMKQVKNRLETAAKINHQTGRWAIAAVDASYRSQLSYALGREFPLVLLVQSEIFSQLNQDLLRAVVARSRGTLVNVVLDLTSGTVRRVTIDGTTYLALDIAA